MADKQYLKEKSKGGTGDKAPVRVDKKHEFLEKSLKKTKAELKASEERFKNIIEKNADGIIVIDSDGVVHFINPASEDLFGLEKKKILGKSFGLPIVEGESSEMTVVHSDGEILWVELRVVESKWEDKSVSLVSVRDITRRKRAEEQLIHNAFHSELTDLPNRALFMDRLEQFCERMKPNEDSSFALLFVDIDRFKVINDSIGLTAGNKVLVTVAEMLESCLSKVDTIAHFGGDEFAILMENIKDLGGVMHVVNRIQSNLASPVKVDGQEVYVSMSIGIRFGDSHSYDPEALVRDAENAMHRIKEKGGGAYQIFDQEMHTRAINNVQSELEIRRAIEREEFLVYYQPIVSLSERRITGFEALIRWQHPERGIVSPGEFLPIVNEIGMIIPVCEISLRAACRQNRIWNSMGLPPIYASVNISAVQFSQRDFADSVARILKDTGLDPNLLVLELVEDSLIEDVEANLKILHEVREMGIRISIDDFGTGYSSLSYLKRFPLNTIKIDRSFVMELPDDSEIVSAIITMGKSLKLKVLAEGVETQEQLNFLYNFGCDEIQGYLFSRPIPAEEFTELLHQSDSLLSMIPTGDK